MSLHHHALRRQAILNALNTRSELGPAGAPGAPFIDLGADGDAFEDLCGQALMVCGGSGSEPIRPISPRMNGEAGR